MINISKNLSIYFYKYTNPSVNTERFVYFLSSYYALLYCSKLVLRKSICIAKPYTVCSPSLRIVIIIITVKQILNPKNKR